MGIDGEGKISRAEFIAAHPETVSEEAAGTLFDSFDSEKSGSLSVSGLASAMKVQRGAQGASGQFGDTSQSTAQDLEQTLLDSLFGESKDSSSQDSTSSTASSGTGSIQNLLGSLLQQYQTARHSYGARTNYASSSVGSAVSVSA